MNARAWWLCAGWMSLALLAQGADCGCLPVPEPVEKYRVQFHPGPTRADPGTFRVDESSGRSYAIEVPVPKDAGSRDVSEFTNLHWNPSGKPAFVATGPDGLSVFALKGQRFQPVPLPGGVDKTLIPTGWVKDRIFLLPEHGNSTTYPAHLTLVMKSNGSGSWSLQKVSRDGTGSFPLKGGLSPHGRYEIRYVATPHPHGTSTWDLDLIEVHTGKTLASIPDGGLRRSPESVHWHPRYPVFTVTTHEENNRFTSVYAWRASRLELLWPTPSNYPTYEEDLRKAKISLFQFEKWQGDDLWISEYLDDWGDAPGHLAHGTLRLRYIDRPGAPMQVLSKVEWTDRPPLQPKVAK